MAIEAHIRARSHTSQQSSQSVSPRSPSPSPPASSVIRIVTFSTLFPNPVQPTHAVFVENRLRHLIGSTRVVSQVIAPVPWFPAMAPLFARYFATYSEYRRIPSRESRNGVSVLHPRFIALPKIGMTVAPGFLFMCALKSFRRLQSESGNFDIIDAHYFYPDGVAAILVGKFLRKPVVITARGTDINFIPRYAVPRAMIRYAARNAAGIIAVSQALKDALVGLGVAEHRIRVLPNGVDLVQFRPADREGARAALGLSGRVLLSVGLLIERKGHDLVIGALALLPACTLLIVGEGPQRAHLQDLAARLRVSDRVRFLGRIPHHELPAIYTAADALVLASSREGWANVLLESMACGTPVVASNSWGNPEVVSRPEAGVLMRQLNPEGVAIAVQDLFQNLPQRTETRRFAEQHGWDATSAGQLELFNEVLSDSRSGLAAGRHHRCRNWRGS
jgi:teichuronic acid biosynthesis glycosyltransferase TuaC